MWFTRGKKVSKKDQLKRLAIKNLISIETNNNIRYNEKYFSKIEKLFRIFLEKQYKLKRGLTHEELSEAIKLKKLKKGLRPRIIYLSAQINGIEYGNSDLDKKILNKLIISLNKIIKES